MTGLQVPLARLASSETMPAGSDIGSPKRRSSGGFRSVLGFVALSIFIGCGGSGGGCGGSGGMGGIQPIKGGYPSAKRIDNAISLRVTKPFFDFIEGNAKPLVDQFIPPTGIPVPSGCTGDFQLCCGQTCKVRFDFQSLKFAPTPPATTKFTLRAKIKTDTDMNIKYKSGIINLNCKLAIDSTRKGAQDIGVTASLNASVNAESKLASLDIDTNSVDILDFDNDDIEIKGDLVCGTINLLKGLFIGTFKDQLKKQLATPLDGMLCSKCMNKDECQSVADACTGGKCMRKGQCLQVLGTEGRIPLGTANLDIYAYAGNYATVEAAPNSGLSLGMLGGSSTPDKSPCAPTRPAPTGGAGLGKTPAFSGNTAPNGKTFHIGAGISTVELDSFGHSFYESGGLCMGIGTEQVELLSSGLLSALIPSLNDLTKGQNSALQIVIRPQQPPTFTLGKGTFKTDGMGKRVIDDPLLHLNVKDLALDFYVYMDERYVRFMRQTMDLDVPLGLDVDGLSQIIPVLGDLGAAAGNVRVTDSALLKESPTQLSRLLPSLLPLLLGQVSSGLGTIKLPSFIGLDLIPVQITSTNDTMGKLSYLGLFLGIKTSGMPLTTEPALWGGISAAAQSPINTYADLVSLEVPTAAAMRDGQSPKVTLQLGSDAPGGAEWQYRVDGGLWQPFDDRRFVTLNDSVLRLVGNHAIEVRARIAGAPETLDPTPARVDFFVTPPAEPTDKAAGATASATDVVNAQTAAGCSLAGPGSTGSPRGAVGLLGLLVGGGLLVAAARRRRARALLAMSLASTMGVVGCSDETIKPDDNMNNNGGPDLSEPAGMPKPEYRDSDEIGRYQGAAFKDGKLYISAYNATWGDLAFTEVAFADAPSAKLTWLPVDGVPSGDPDSTSPDAYRGGYEEPGDDVGRFTALKLTAQGTPVVAYQDLTNNAVKLAIRKGDKWSTSAVTDAKDGKGIGGFVSMVLSDSDVPTVAYMIQAVPKAMGAMASQLVVATAKSATPAGPADWDKKVVDESPVPCGGFCAMGEACVYVDPMKKDKYATVCKATVNTCAPACKSGTACVAAKCVDALGTPPAGEPEGTGLYARLVRNGAVNQVVFHTKQTGALKLASSPDWKVQVVDGGDGKVVAGKYIGAAPAMDGSLAVAYGDGTGRLLYRTVKGTMLGAVEVVDDGSRTVKMVAETHTVGAGVQLVFDGGKPVLVYQDQTAGSLETARKDAMWTKKTLGVPAGSTNRGYYPQLVSNGSKWLALDVVYDRQATALTTVAASPL